MLDRLPIFINPLSFAERGKRLLGKVKINELPRLSEILLDTAGEIEIDFSFDREGPVPFIEGEIKANLIAECQSCLKQVILPIEKHFKLGMVTSEEQADRLSSDYEPLFLQDEKVSLNELIEDELLLALPDFPKHPEVCVEREGLKMATIETLNDEQQVNSNNPFSVLAKLKNTGD